MRLPRSLPWWGWLLIAIGLIGVGLFTTAIIVRQRGWRELNAFAAQMRAEGRGLTPADLIAEAPPVDAARQERAYNLVGKGSLYTHNESIQTWGMSAYLAAPQAQQALADETANVLKNSAACRKQWRELRTEGPVVLSLMGWVKQDVPEPDQADFGKMWLSRMPGLLSMRQLAQAFATEARNAANPEPALSELDALAAACAPAGSLIDGKNAIEVSQIRDEAWLEATLRGTNPQLWSTVQSQFRINTAHTLRAVRLTLGGSFYQEILHRNLRFDNLWDMTLSYMKKGHFSYPAKEIIYALFAQNDVLLLNQWLLVGEGICQTNTGSTATLDAEISASRWRFQISDLVLRDLSKDFFAAIQADVAHRRIRLAALLAHDYRQTHSLPKTAADLTEAQKALAAAADFEPAILYQRISPTRFRLWSDPATPASPLLPAGRIDAPKPTTARWTSKRGSWWLELDLAEQTTP